MSIQFRCKLLLILLFFSALSIGQNTENKSDIKKDSTSPKTYYSYGFEYFLTQTTGNNALSNGAQGIGGFNMKIQLGLYKGIFIGGSVGSSYLEVTNSAFTGNYKKSTLSNRYLFLGYEHYLSKKFVIGGSYGFLGTTEYKNKIFSNSEGRQFDSGSFSVLEFYVDYKITKLLVVYLNYGFRKDNLDIQAPSEIQNQFSEARFNNFGIGIKLGFGHTTILESFLK